MQDFEDDEAGKIPRDLKRGVLSEDAVYDLLTENRELLVRMLRLVTGAPPACGFLRTGWPCLGAPCLGAPCGWPCLGAPCLGVPCGCPCLGAPCLGAPCGCCTGLCGAGFFTG